MIVTVDTRTPRLNALHKQLSPVGRKTLHAAGAESLWSACRSHLRTYAQSHHRTATRLGAQPTGHLEQAAASSTWHADETSGQVEIAAPGIRRVFSDLDIKPRRARELTIPIHALAYGRRVAEVSRTHQIFRPKRKGGKPANYLAAVIDGQFTPLYVLVRRAVVPQDRTILPDDAAMSSAAASGMLAIIHRTIESEVAS